MLNPEQRGVLRGMLGALTLSVLGFVAVIIWKPDHPGSSTSPLGNSGTMLKWDILLAIAVAANIAAIARHRFFTPADINGSGLTNGTAQVRILQAVLQNTIEQTVLALPIHVIWIATMTPAWQGIVPTAAVFFLIGRILFWRGYGAGAAARSFGFALTFYPSLIMLLLLCFHFLRP